MRNIKFLWILWLFSLFLKLWASFRRMISARQKTWNFLSLKLNFSTNWNTIFLSEKFGFSVKILKDRKWKLGLALCGARAPECLVPFSPRALLRLHFPGGSSSPAHYSPSFGKPFLASGQRVRDQPLGGCWGLEAFELKFCWGTSCDIFPGSKLCR